MIRLSPHAVAPDSYEVRGAHTRNAASWERATEAHKTYADLIRGNRFEGSRTVVTERLFIDQRSNLADVGVRNVIGTRSKDFNVSGASSEQGCSK